MINWLLHFPIYLYKLESFQACFQFSTKRPVLKDEVNPSVKPFLLSHSHIALCYLKLVWANSPLKRFPSPPVNKNGILCMPSVNNGRPCISALSPVCILYAPLMLTKCLPQGGTSTLTVSVFQQSPPPCDTPEAVLPWGRYRSRSI